MRLAAPFFLTPRTALAASFFAALKAPFGKPRTPSTTQSAPVYCLSQRVRVALQAAARARR